MAKKIVRTTTEELAAAIEKENLGTFNSVTEVPVREPGTVGISKTEAGNFLVYCVKDNRKLFNQSVHPEIELANGRALERLRQMAGLPKDGIVETETPADAVAEVSEAAADPVWSGMDFDALAATV